MHEVMSHIPIGIANVIDGTPNTKIHSYTNKRGQSMYSVKKVRLRVIMGPEKNQCAERMN